MKGGYKHSTTWIQWLTAAAWLQQLVTVSAGFTMSQTCAQLGKGWIADPRDCRSFGFCEEGLLVGTSQCPNNYVYNPRRGECQFPTAGVCSVANVCEYAPDKSFAANPSDCSSYYYCENKKARPAACPAGQVFDRVTTSCTWKAYSKSNMCTANSICHLVKDGSFVGDPNQCGEYLSCVNGIGTYGKCPSGLHYNKLKGGCQSSNPCNSPRDTSVGLGVRQALPTNPEACKGVTEGPVMVSDQKTCMGYYVCLSAAGPGAWRKCDPGLHFDNGKCVSPFSVACAFDRCGNMNQEFVGAINTGCKNYLLCRNQTSRALTYTNYVGLPCPPENPYFDEYTQSCLPTSPATTKYKLCV